MYAAAKSQKGQHAILDNVWFPAAWYFHICAGLQVHANMCNQQWYVIGDFCQSSCDRCFCSGACSDSPPDNRYSCEQQVNTLPES